MKVYFDNTNYFMKPEDQELQPVPNNFEIVAKLPPQQGTIISQEAELSVETAGQTLVVSNFGLSFFAVHQLNFFFSSILSLQILAHQPLANVHLPANAHQAFSIMIQVVSFDYFEFTDVIALDFSPTDPWSEPFDNLDYGSVNFLESLGSITFFIWVGAAYSLLTFLLWLVGIKCSCIKCCIKLFKP